MIFFLFLLQNIDCGYSLEPPRDIFLIFAQNIDCVYTLEPPRGGGGGGSTHNLCFGAKIRKIGIPL